MKHTTGIRAAAVAAAVMAAGLAAAVPANAAETQTAARTTARITSQEQLRASILKAVTNEDVVCGAGASFGVHPMGGYPPPPIGPAAVVLG
jgi:pyruvate kinase